MSSIFTHEKLSHICRLVARTGLRPSIADPYVYMHSNIEGTTRMLDLARQHQCNR